MWRVCNNSTSLYHRSFRKQLCSFCLYAHVAYSFLLARASPIALKPWAFWFIAHINILFNPAFAAWLQGSGAAVDMQVKSHCQRKLSTSSMLSVSSESTMHQVPTPDFYKLLSLFQHSYLVSAFTSYIFDLLPDLLLLTNQSVKHIQKGWESLKCSRTTKPCLLSHLRYRCFIVRSFHLGVFWPFCFVYP